MSRKRRVGSIAYFEDVRRRQARADRKAAIETPAHFASGRPIALKDREGTWRVFSPPPGSKQIAGPFDTADEANEWIDNDAPRARDALPGR